MCVVWVNQYANHNKNLVMLQFFSRNVTRGGRSVKHGVNDDVTLFVCILMALCVAMNE